MTTIELPPRVVHEGFWLPIVEHPHIARRVDGNPRIPIQGVARIARAIRRNGFTHFALGRWTLGGVDAAKLAHPVRRRPRGCASGFARSNGKPKLATHTVSFPSTAIPHGMVRPPPVKGELTSGVRLGSR